jgi:ribonuclease D
VTPTVSVSPEVIDSPDGLQALAQALAREERLGVDTESNSLHAFRERVCLVQFSTPKADYIIDPLALDDLDPLRVIFSSPRIQKIFHACEYDIICLRRDYGFEFANIFDTMQAGRILGRKQAGLDRLLEEKFDVKASKKLQKADWGARPLSRELLEYAALDTHYLIPLQEIMGAELRAKELLALAEEDFDMLCRADGQKTKATLPAWEKFAVRRDLGRRELTILKQLLDCRDRIAERLDRPPFKVIDDEHLIQIARTQPGDRDALRALGLGARQTELWGDELLAALKAGMNDPLVQRTRVKRPSGQYLRRLDKLKTWRKKAAAEMDVDSDVVLPRSLLLALAEDGSQAEVIMRSSPWRWQRYGAKISSLLAETNPDATGG